MRVLCWMLLLGLIAEADARRLGELEFEACSLSGPAGAEVRAAQCATLAVPEDPDRPEGRSITLAIGWVPASGDEEPDPVFMLAGGPGQSARASFPQIAGAFRDLLRKRHVILVDQRGTGGSNPLSCAADDDLAALDGDDPAQARAFAERCRDALAERADLRLYGTREAVADLDAVRQAIGAERINLIGISYGTRVAQQYAMRHPRHSRSLVLDSVVPNRLVLGAEHARALEDALQRYADLCTGDAVCHARFGDPLATLHAQLARLRDAPVTVRFRDAVSAEWREERFRAGHLLGLARMYSYTPATAAMLPLLAGQVARGEFDALAAQAWMVLDSLDASIHQGMSLSVSCTEDADELSAREDDAGTLFGTDFVAAILAQCAIWPRGTRVADFRTPLSGALPVLLLSGGNDPVTPPRYGDEVAAELPNSRHLVLAGQGHNVLVVGCTPRLVARFVETADARGLDAGCLDGLAPSAPFVGFYGWEP